MMRALQHFKLVSLLFGLLTAEAVSEGIPNKARPEQAQLLFDRAQANIRVEVVDTPEERAKGLMNREELAAGSGMLFVFPDDKVRGVWMKNTLIPLDILFMSADGRVLSLLQRVPPCKADDCDVYYSAAPARYMLEVNAGFIDHWAIEPGDKITRLE